MSKNEIASNIEELRARARRHLTDGALTSNYGGDVENALKMLNDALATELTCVLRYRFHYVAAQGIDSEAVKAEFLQHANEEQAHADRIAERINQLGGKANFDPATFAARSATEYREGKNLIDMIKEDLVAERIAVEHYRDLVRYHFGEKDPTITAQRHARGTFSRRKKNTRTTCMTFWWRTKGLPR